MPEPGENPNRPLLHHFPTAKVHELRPVALGLLAQVRGLATVGFTAANYREARTQASTLFENLYSSADDVDQTKYTESISFDDAIAAYDDLRRILDKQEEFAEIRDEIALPPVVGNVGVWDPAPRVKERRQKQAMHMAAVNLPRLIEQLQKTSPLEQRQIDAAIVGRAESIVGRRFRKKFLLRMALTQASAKSNLYPSYERLETLGDAVLNLVVIKALYALEPWLSPHEITSRKSAITANVELARRTRLLGLDKLIYMAPGQNLSDDIEADVYEAVVGALFLDGGILAATKFVLRDLEPLIVSQVAENSKSKLTRVMDAAKKRLKYRVINKQGPEHDLTWTVIVTIDGRKFGEGTGKTKQEAEQNAATAALKVMDAVAALGAT